MPVLPTRHNTRMPRLCGRIRLAAPPTKARRAKARPLQALDQRLRDGRIPPAMTSVKAWGATSSWAERSRAAPNPHGLIEFRQQAQAGQCSTIGEMTFNDADTSAGKRPYFARHVAAGRHFEVVVGVVSQIFQ